MGIRWRLQPPWNLPGSPALPRRKSAKTCPILVALVAGVWDTMSIPWKRVTIQWKKSKHVKKRLDIVFLRKSSMQRCVSTLHISCTRASESAIWRLFCSNALAFSSGFLYCDTIDCRAKKVGFKTCVTLALVNDNDTGREPNEDRKHWHQGHD